MSAEVFAVVTVFHLPSEHPFTLAVKWMLGMCALSVVLSAANLFIKVRAERRARLYQADAEQNARDVRELLAVVRARFAQTMEHRDEAAATLVRVEQAAGQVKDVVEQTGDQIVQTVRQVVSQNPGGSQ